jgi:CRP-like cAMP-binding protein
MKLPEDKKSTEKAIELLTENRLFGVLPEEKRREIAAAAKDDVRAFEAGELIYSPERFRKALGLVISGSVSVTRRGDKTVLLNRLTEGGIFGAAGLFCENAKHGNGAGGVNAGGRGANSGAGNTTGSVSASTAGGNYVTEIRADNALTVLFVDGDVVRELVRTVPEFAEAYICFLSERIRFLNARIVDFTAQCADAKLAGFLYRSSRGGSETTENVNMSALAKAIDVGRASLYRAIDSLVEKGLIRKTERSFEILDPEGLKRLAGAG